MRLIDTHRLLLGEVVVMMSKKTWGRADADNRISLAPGAQGAIAFRHTTSAYAIYGDHESLIEKLKLNDTGILMLFEVENVREFRVAGGQASCNCQPPPSSLVASRIYFDELLHNDATNSEIELK